VKVGGSDVPSDGAPVHEPRRRVTCPVLGGCVMQPYDFEQAVAAAREASAMQRAAETAMRDAAREYAQAEERYRVALAKEIVRQHADEGVAWTVAPDLARGNVTVARLRRERDISEGVREAQQQAAWRRPRTARTRSASSTGAPDASSPRATGTRLSRVRRTDRRSSVTKLSPAQEKLLHHRSSHDAVTREAELLAALSAIVRAYDHPPDGTAHDRVRAGIADARNLLGLAPVAGVDGEPA
jgi:hypothetical protein